MLVVRSYQSRMSVRYMANVMHSQDTRADVSGFGIRKRMLATTKVFLRTL